MLQLKLHLTRKVESIYEVLPPEEKAIFALASEALGKRLQPAKRDALTLAQLLKMRQKPGEGVDNYVQEFERLFEESYGHRVDVDATFKGVLKRDIFVQGLLLKWQEKVLPSATTFADALHQARTVEEQEKQLGEMHHRSYLGRKESTERDRQGKAAKANGKAPPVEQPVLTPPVERMIQRSSPRDRSKVQCYCCHGFGHIARECPLRRAATEALINLTTPISANPVSLSCTPNPGTITPNSSTTLVPNKQSSPTGP